MAARVTAHVGGEGAEVVTDRVQGNMSISEAIKEIREKLEAGGQDHGLFQPANPKVGRAARWLRGDRTFNFFDVSRAKTVCCRVHALTSHVCARACNRVKCHA